jgi:large subunit ribosomal protein L10
VNRAQKTAFVEQMNRRFAEAPHVILASFRGLTANQATSLRSRIRQAGGRLQVIQNRLAKRAAGGTPAEPLVEHFAGPCAIASHESDPVELAKVLAEFAKQNPQLELLAGLVDARDVLDPRAVQQLSKLPGLDELRAQLLSLIQAPAAQLVRLLGTPGTQLARVVETRREAQEQG